MGPGSTGSFNGLSHFGLYVKDIEVSKAFYVERLGFSLLHENSLETDAGTIYAAFVDLHGATIELIQAPGESGRVDGLFDHLAIDVTDIEECVKQLEQRGIVFEEEIFFAEHFWQGGSKWALFRGPDGEHLELNERL